MSRHTALTLLIAVGVLATLGAWVFAPPPPQEAIEPKLPPEILQRIAKLEAAEKVEPPQTPPTVEPQVEAPEPIIERTAVDGQDLADLQGLLMWKFHFLVPTDGKDVTAYIWSERWTRDDDSPEYELLETFSGAWGDNDLVIKLPQGENDQVFIRIDQIGNLGAPREEPILPPEPRFLSVLDSQRLRLDQPIHLITMTHNLTERMRGGLRDVHGDHDVTVYIKAGFTAGSYVPFDPAQWIGGPAAQPEKDADADDAAGE